MGKLSRAAAATILALALAPAAADVRAQGTGADLLIPTAGIIDLCGPTLSIRWT